MGIGAGDSCQWRLFIPVSSWQRRNFMTMEIACRYVFLHKLIISGDDYFLPYHYSSLVQT